MKNKLVLWLISFLVSGILHGRNFDEQELNQIAISDGFGFKYGNLLLLKRLLENIEAGPYQIRVPVFLGVSSNQIKATLENFVDVNKTWAAIVASHYPEQKDRDEALKAKRFSDAFLNDIKGLREKIAQAFAQILADPDSHLKALSLSEILATAKQNRYRLMVRSSGKEDTKELANAGGNESVSNVEPAALPILQAMEKVVISYFQEKSLKQRIAVGDVSIFSEPFTPVLIQRMVGVDTTGNISKAGVMFTEEPEGGIARYSANDRALTTGITIIQSAYGHNEGVVNSLIPVDTYYVNNQKHIYAIIRKKTFRVMPTKVSGELVQEKNESELIQVSSLNTAAIFALKDLAKRLEDYFGTPRDVEFVVDETAKTIYVVQARPIVNNPDLPDASYINDLSSIKKQPHFLGSAIGAAGGSVRLCSKDETVIAKDLGSALSQYQDLPSSQQVGCVIVGKSAPSTSHEATTFRGEAKPVIYFEGWREIEYWLQNPTTKILLSPQQHVVVKMEENQDLPAFAKGWVNYPAPPHLTMAPDFISSEDWLTDKAIKSLYEPLNDPKRWETLQKLALSVDTKMLFEQLLSKNEVEVSAALASLLIRLKYGIEKNSRELTLDEDQKTRIRILQNYAWQLASDINANIASSPGEIGFAKRLLPIHFLKTLFFQTPSDGEVVSDFSALYLLGKELAVETRLLKELREKNVVLKNALSLQFLKVGNLAASDELEKQWFDFVVNLDQEKDERLLIKFSEMLKGLAKLKTLETWLHFVFVKTPDARALVKEFEDIAPFLNQLKQKSEAIEAINVASFADPASFPTAWSHFKSNLVDFFATTQFRNDYLVNQIIEQPPTLTPEDPGYVWENSEQYYVEPIIIKKPLLQKLVAISVMGQLVDKFDLAIKELKASREISEAAKLAFFRGMLKSYFSLLTSWIKLDTDGKFGNPHMHLMLLESVLNKAELNKADLSFTDNFDVASFVLGSGGIFETGMVPPTTLEDGFSVIHQDLIMVLGLATIKALGAIPGLPKELKLVANTIISNNYESSARKGKAQIIAVEVKNRGYILHLSKPLRAHGVLYSISQQRGEQEVYLSVRFANRNEGNRWDYLAHYMLALDLYQKLPVKNIELRRMGLSFDAILRPEHLASFPFSLVEIRSSDLASVSYLKSKAKPLEDASRTLIKIAGSTVSALTMVKRFEEVVGIVSMSVSDEIFAHFTEAAREDPKYMTGLLQRTREAARTFKPSANESEGDVRLDDMAEKIEQSLARQAL
jgi:hypothetical protein